MREIDEKLCLAVASDDTKTINECLNNGANPLTVLGDKGMTIAHAAANKNKESALRILLDFTQNKILEAKGGEDESTLLTCAVAGGYENIIRLLLTRGANIETRGKSEATPLIEAIGQGRPNIVKLLVDNKANVNAISDGSRPLELAINIENLEIIKILIVAKANLEAKDQNGKTALLRAVQNENIPIVKLLLEHGANINAQDNDQRAPLHIAAGKGNFALLQLLLTKSAAVDTQAAKGATPLHLAVIENINCVDLLLKNGANPNALSDELGTPFMQAIMIGNEKLINLFLNTQKITIDTITFALYLAISNKHAATVNLLLQNGADPNAKNLIHAKLAARTPLHEAVDSNFEPIVKLLLDKNADPLLPDSTGKTAKDLAAEKKLRSISKLIEKKCNQMNSRGFSGSPTTPALFKPAPSIPQPKHNLETDQLLEKTQPDTSSKCCVII